MKESKYLVRGGGDIRLGNAAMGDSTLSSSDPTDVCCMKQAIKNATYTMSSTYHFAKNYKDETGEEFNAAQSVAKRVAWWKVIAYVLDGVVLAGTRFWIYGAFFHEKKNKKETNANLKK